MEQRNTQRTKVLVPKLNQTSTNFSVGWQQSFKGLAGRPCLNKKLKGHKSAGESSPTLRIPHSRTGRTTLR